MSNHQPDLVALGRLLLILNEFRKAYPEMPVQMAATLVTVAHYPGLSVTELANLSGNTLASCSRHLETLGPYNEVKKVGLGLIEKGYSPSDRRKQIHNLSPAGASLVRSVVDVINRWT